MPYDQEYKLEGVFLVLFCKQPQISSDVWLFHLLSYPQYKPRFLASWIPLAYSILTMQVMANLHRQSKQGAKREQVGMLPSTIPLCEQPCPLSHLSHFSALTNQLKDTAALQAEALWVLLAGIRHLQSCFPTLKAPVQRAVWPPEQLCRMQAHPKPNRALPKSYYWEPTGLHHNYRLPVREETGSEKAKRWLKEGDRKRKEVWLQVRVKEKKPPPQQHLKNTKIVCRKVLFCSACLVLQTQVSSFLMLSTRWSKGKRPPWKYTQINDS